MSTKGDILIVDDDPDFTQAVKMTLENAGFSVRSASSGRQGLEMMREARPDLVFLDVIMVTPTEGVYISQEIADDPDLRDLPIIMVTSIVSSEYIDHFPTDGTLQIDMFLSKPVPLQRFVEIADRIVQRKQPTA